MSSLNHYQRFLALAPPGLKSDDKMDAFYEHVSALDRTTRGRGAVAISSENFCLRSELSRARVTTFLEECITKG